MPNVPKIYTIGHSDHATEAFVGLLRDHNITLVVDVRSQPYSRWMPQFNRETFQEDLENASIGYHFMGDALGGRPSDPAMYDPGQERPNYKRMAEAPDYQAGIDALINLASEAQGVTIMCSEGDYRQCHRHLLITQTLLERGVPVTHIRPDGTTVEGVREAEQLSLF
jgi:uncharacterized protein (DUF488 family)